MSDVPQGAQRAGGAGQRCPEGAVYTPELLREEEVEEIAGREGWALLRCLRLMVCCLERACAPALIRYDE